MDIHGADGSAFQLKVVGYQFPQVVDDGWDSNWLRIYMSVTLPQGSWSVSDPFLTTFEVKSLANWFDSIVDHTQTEQEIGFTEPNLSFAITETASGIPCLRIHFAIECLPPWVDRTNSRSEGVFADFPLSEIDLRSAAAALRSELQLYPQRTSP